MNNPIPKIGDKVRVIYASNDRERFGVIINNNFEAGQMWYWIKFEFVSYALPSNEFEVVS